MTLRFVFIQILITIGVFLSFSKILWAEMTFIEKIMAKPFQSAITDKRRKSNKADIEYSLHSSIRWNNGVLTAYRSSKNMVAAPSYYLRGGVYCNNCLLEATSNRMYDFDIGLFFIYQSISPNGMSFGPEKTFRNLIPKPKTLYPASLLDIQGLELSFRFLGVDSQDFQLALKFRTQFHLEKMEMSSDYDPYLEKFAAYAPGVAMTFYFFPIIGIEGHFFYWKEFNYYTNGTDPSFKQYYSYEGEFFIEIGALRFFGGYSYASRNFESQKFHVTELTLTSYFGGLTFFVHL